ncbi:MAG: DsbA family oxidoreductase [Gammaproteobacteria bacterium]
MTIPITHFSDALCIWAYVSQVRIAELRTHFAEEVTFDYRYFNVFGDVPTKMATQWQAKGGLDGYAGHVHEVAARFEHVRIHADLWTRDAPNSSMPAHLVLCAARVTLDDRSAVLSLDHEVRRSFFETAADISRTHVLLEICERQGLDRAPIERALQDGRAHAALATDMKQAQELGVRSSPTLTFNEGRQTLTGNVGYRVIEANIRELIRDPQDQQSWC